jgi:hypothetical protein
MCQCHVVPAATIATIYRQQACGLADQRCGPFSPAVQVQDRISIISRSRLGDFPFGLSLKPQPIAN